jgi:L-amino acid N-acyltransferase
MTDLILIRRATEQDLGVILEIFNHAIRHTTAVYSYDPYSPKMMMDWFLEKQQNNFPVFVSTDKKKTVTGFVTYGTFRTRPAYKYTVEHSIYVHPDHRQKGIASHLMKHIIQVAEDAQLHSLIGGIDAENTLSIDFHEKFGFTAVGNLKEVGYKFGKWLDLVFMQLILETPLHPKEKDGKA